MGRKTPAYDKILDAAEDIVLERGSTHMTLEAVAARAGVSKGGLIYHFPSQRDLLKGMLVRFQEFMERHIVRCRARLPDTPAREIKTYIMAWFAFGDEYRRVASALLAAVTRDPGLLNDAREKHLEAMRRVLGSATDPERTVILALAAEGVWISSLMGLSSFDKKAREKVKQSLLRLADEWAFPRAGRRRGGCQTLQKDKP